MTSKRLYYLLLGSLCLLILGLVGGTFAANQMLQQQSAKLVSARSNAQSLALQQDQLISTKADIVKYKPLAAIAQDVVPQDKNQAQTVREIVRIAAANGIKLGSITFPSSTLGAGIAVPGSTSSPAVKTPAASGGQSPLSQLKPAVGISGVYDLQIILQSDATNSVPYAKFISFLSGLERNRRTALVNAINLQPDSQVAGNVSFTLTIDEYIKP